MTEQLTVRVRATAAGAVIELAGELDHHTAFLIRDALPGLGLRAGQQLVLDLAQLTFCDSSGITAMIVARNHALSEGASIALADVPGRVDRVIRMVGLDRVFAVHSSASAAEAAWQSQQCAPLPETPRSPGPIAPRDGPRS